MLKHILWKQSKHVFSALQTDIASKYIFHRSYVKLSKGAKIRNRYNQVPHLSRIYTPLSLGLNITKYVLNNLYLCSFIVTKIIAKMSSNIRAPILLNLLKSLRKSDKVLGKPRILSLFPNPFTKSTHVKSYIYYIHRTKVNIIKHGIC